MGITFWHLYTVAALIMALMLLRRLLNGPPPPPCAHSWELVDKTEFAPAIDVHTKNGLKWAGTTNAQDFWIKLTERKVVLVLRCSKCDSPPVIKEITS